MDIIWPFVCTLVPFTISKGRATATTIAVIHQNKVCDWPPNPLRPFTREQCDKGCFWNAPLLYYVSVYLQMDIVWLFNFKCRHIKLTGLNTSHTIQYYIGSYICRGHWTTDWTQWLAASNPKRRSLFMCAYLPLDIGNTKLKIIIFSFGPKRFRPLSRQFGWLAALQPHCPVHRSVAGCSIASGALVRSIHHHQLLH